MVSIVVCYQRNLSTGTGENTATVSLNNDPTCGYVTLSSFEQRRRAVQRQGKRLDRPVRRHSGGKSAVGIAWCRWATTARRHQYLSLNGPDCSRLVTPTTAVSIGKSVIGVYTEPVQVDRDLLW